MKKFCIILLAIWMLCTNALALDATGYPAYDGSAIDADTLAGKIGTDSVMLEFDPSEEYSGCASGYIEACFFAYNQAGDSYIELYLMIPETADAGDVIDPAYAGGVNMGNCSVTLSEVVGNSEIFYIAMQNGTSAYPQNSSYSIRIESKVDTGTAYAVHGTVTAELAEIDELASTGKTIAVDAAFDFTVAKSDDSQAFESPFANDPTHSPAGAAPAFTLPPDYAKI
ncbi:MAG: hypothetical protein HUJ65_03535 [Oscillospiraceae bacterium]|nr:hypothetical protein [Oscillospiraceae bacterium]